MGQGRRLVLPVPASSETRMNTVLGSDWPYSPRRNPNNNVSVGSLDASWDETGVNRRCSRFG